MLKECAVKGLHDYLARTVLAACAVQGGKAIDLGAGSGALALRLQGFGLDVTAVDINRDAFKADVPFVQMNLDRSDYSTTLGEGSFDFVSAVEIIEHLESPISFLLNVGRLLKPDGIALITTPNMDNVPSRVRFLLTGKLHVMDEKVPNHISPIFYDLFIGKYLPRAGLNMVGHFLYPCDDYKVSRACYAWALRILAFMLPGHTLGDVHIFVLRPVIKETRM
jgi:2-polyprenyl-3-methyl-5-hydroxy-6-metoxy-1,4-benzoquinol methylase